MVVVREIVARVEPVCLAVPDEELAPPSVVVAPPRHPPLTVWLKNAPATSDCPPGWPVKTEKGPRGISVRTVTSGWARTRPAMLVDRAKDWVIGATFRAGLQGAKVR